MLTLGLLFGRANQLLKAAPEFRLRASVGLARNERNLNHRLPLGLHLNYLGHTDNRVFTLISDQFGHTLTQRRPNLNSHLTGVTPAIGFAASPVELLAHQRQGTGPAFVRSSLRQPSTRLAIVS